MRGYNLHKSRQDSSILVAKKGRKRIELKKVNISSYEKSNKNKGGSNSGNSKGRYASTNRTRLTNNNNITPYNYSYKQLLKTDVHQLSMLYSQAHEVIQSEYKKLHKAKYGTAKYRNLSQKIDKYSKFADDAHRAKVVQKGLIAKEKLARDDYKTATGLEMLIEDSVELDMLPYRQED